MYTQCQHCKAIFEVSMREVTIAAGKLRCGECNEVFDAMLTLSTTLPEPFSPDTDPSGTAFDSSQTKKETSTQQSLSTNRANNQRPENSQATGIKENVKDIVTQHFYFIRLMCGCATKILTVIIQNLCKQQDCQ